MNEIEKAIEQLKHDKENFEDLLKENRPSTIKERVENIIKAHKLAISALEKRLNDRWVPVSERLPDNNTKVQVTGVRYSEYTKKNIYVRFNAKYIGKHSIKVDDMWSYCEDYTWNDYVEEEDEYYVKEGWYETIENWDDYTEVYVNDYKVIAWQPLPPVWKGNI